MSLGPRELDLLIACGRPFPSAVDDVSRILEGGVDWPGLLSLARSDGLLPLLSYLLTRCPSALIPPEISSEIRRQAETLAIRGLLLTRELGHVMAKLESKGLTPIAFKGPVLAHLAYGNFGLRDSADLDLFIPPTQIHLAIAQLEQCGYRKKSEGRLSWLSGECEIALIRHDPNGEVDLHWHFSPPYFLGLDSKRASERSVMFRSPGLNVRTLANEDLLLYLCIHAGRECWLPLRSICDLAAFIRNSVLDWDDIVREAQRHRCWRAVAVGLILVSDLMQVSLPDKIQAKAMSDTAARRIAKDLEKNLSRNVLHNYAGSPGGALTQLRLMKGISGKLQYLARRALQPNHFDADLVRLPRILSSAYYLVRPVRLTAVALARLRLS